MYVVSNWVFQRQWTKKELTNPYRDIMVAKYVDYIWLLNNNNS